MRQFCWRSCNTHISNCSCWSHWSSTSFSEIRHGSPLGCAPVPFGKARAAGCRPNYRTQGHMYVSIYWGNWYHDRRITTRAFHTRKKPFCEVSTVFIGDYHIQTWDPTRWQRSRGSMSYFSTLQVDRLPLTVILACVVVVLSVNLMFGRNKWDPKGQVRAFYLILFPTVTEMVWPALELIALLRDWWKPRNRSISGSVASETGCPCFHRSSRSEEAEGSSWETGGM